MSSKELMNQFESFLEQAVSRPEDSRVAEAMKYSLMAGGKRIRPRLLFALMSDYGMDPAQAIPAAAALEMIHTYSLIHDDLPAMDNDVLRRGKPTCHVQFDEPTAILAGDGLLTRAFGTVLEAEIPAEDKVLLVDMLSNMSGVCGMIYGQELDIAADNQLDSLDQLENIEAYKTGCLLTLPFAMAAVIAHHPEDQAAWQEIGRLLGLEFQIQDDILEITRTDEELGKSRSDADNDKMTAISVLGLEGACKKVEQLHEAVMEKLEQLPLQGTAVKDIILELLNRDH